MTFNYVDLFSDKDAAIEAVNNISKEFHRIHDSMSNQNQQITINNEFKLTDIEKKTENDIKNQIFTFKNNKYKVIFTMSPRFKRVGFGEHLVEYNFKAKAGLIDEFETTDISICENLDDLAKFNITANIDISITVLETFNYLAYFVPKAFDKVDQMHQTPDLLTEILDIGFELR